MRSHDSTKKRSWKPLALGVAILLLLVGGLYARTLETPWTEFRSPECGFRCLFPAPPNTKTVPAPKSGGVPTKVFLWGSGYEDEVLSVEVADFEVDVNEAARARVFDSIEKLKLQSLDSVPLMDPKLISSQPCTVEGNPGRDVVIDLKRGSGTMRVRMFLVGRRLFCLNTAVHSHHSGENDARFLASFKLETP